ncbi:hypothetical protein J28TS4_61830 [Paenibacillus lautus]|nr:hypothetical protein J28TS4_61830 [Paenibacillus lautus]
MDGKRKEIKFQQIFQKVFLILVKWFMIRRSVIFLTVRGERNFNEQEVCSYHADTAAHGDSCAFRLREKRRA